MSFHLQKDIYTGWKECNESDFLINKNMNIVTTNEACFYKDTQTLEACNTI